MCVQLCPALCDPMDYSPPWTLSMGFFRHQYWSRSPFLSPKDLPHPGIEPVSLMSPALQADYLPAEPSGKPIFIHMYIQPSYFSVFLKLTQSLCCSVAQSWLTLYDPMDCSPPGSSTHEILQVRILKWIITSYSKIFISTYLYVYVIPISIW